jgi:DNA-binding GntR family transcriptional regulator
VGQPHTGAGTPVRDSGRLVEDVHAQLVEMIRSGKLRPNERLHQVQLAERFGVSRTPVREALLRMEQDGLVHTIPRRGMFVRPLAQEDVRQLYELRELLEPWAARVACQRATDKDRAALASIQAKHERRLPSFDSNRDFHLQLAKPCGNDMALRTLQSIWAQDASHRVYTAYGDQPQALEQMVREHRQIVDAFLAGEAQKVEQLVRDHIRDAATVTESKVAAEPEANSQLADRRADRGDRD